MISLIKIKSQEKKQEENNIYKNLTQFYQASLATYIMNAI